LIPGLASNANQDHIGVLITDLLLILQSTTSCSQYAVFRVRVRLLYALSAGRLVPCGPNGFPIIPDALGHLPVCS